MLRPLLRYATLRPLCQTLPASESGWQPWVLCRFASGKQVSTNADFSGGESRGQDLVTKPPLPVRVSLVGASTAFATPLFPIIGFNHLVFRFATPEMRMVIHGGTSMVYFSTMVLLPNAFYYAPVLLPFAFGNGITAAILYLVAERASGGPEALASWKIFDRIPVAGPLLGLSTALLVPLTYPISWNLFYPGELGVLAFNSEVYDMIITWCYKFGPGMSCLAATGLASGFLLHLFLRPVVLGLPGLPWQKLAGVVLSATVLSLGALYSTSFRTHVPSLKGVNIEQIPEPSGFFGWLFPERVPCFVNGVGELCWIPALDPATGGVGSEQWKVAVDADGRLQVDQQYHEGRPRVAGLGMFETSDLLRKKALDKRVKVYTSQRAAYFDGFGYEPIDKSSVAHLSEELPIGEAIMTDALVMVLTGSPAALLERSLGTVLPALSESSLVKRLDSSLNPLRHSWTSDLQTPEGLKAFLRELALRTAHLREFLRLEAGAEGPWTAEELREELEAAGVDLSRASAALRRLGWAPDQGGQQRSADWALMRGHRRQQMYTGAGGAALVGGSIVAVALLGSWLAGRGS